MSYNVMGDLVVIANDSALVRQLEPATYLICVNDQIGYHLKKVDPLKLPSKVYGDNPELVEKVLKLFEDEQGRTSGVMLYGAKGTGKTMTAVGACIEANKRGYPVLLLQSDFHGSTFNDFMSKITDSCIVFIDEFEKIFDDQDAINSTLMLLDGAVKTHKLFILTSNSAMDAEDSGLEYISNRPSRVFYNIYYGTMEDSIIEEYLDDNLKHAEYRADILAFKRSFKIFTIDILKAIVAEVNRYGHTGDSFTNLMKHLNVKTDRGLKDYEYEVTMKVGDFVFKPVDFMEKASQWQVNGAALSAILSSEGYNNDFDWSLIVPSSVLDHFEKHPSSLLNMRGHVYAEADETGERKLIARHVCVGAYRIQYKNGMLKATQDKVTRAITLADNTGDVSITFTPQLETHKGLEEFII